MKLPVIKPHIRGLNRSNWTTRLAPCNCELDESGQGSSGRRPRESKFSLSSHKWTLYTVGAPLTLPLPYPRVDEQPTGFPESLSSPPQVDGSVGYLDLPSHSLGLPFRSLADPLIRSATCRRASGQPPPRKRPTMPRPPPIGCVKIHFPCVQVLLSEEPLPAGYSFGRGIK